jgi:oligopeptide/dipeptide ABC transporter ATP-binding protein
MVQRMCDRVAIMYLGRIVETGPARAIFAAPRYPYTRALLAAAPRLDANPDASRDASEDPGRQLGGGMLEGEPPSPRNLPSGCASRTRCPHAIPPCAAAVPPMQPAESADHAVACIRWREIAGDARLSLSPSSFTMGRGLG